MTYRILSDLQHIIFLCLQFITCRIFLCEYINDFYTILILLIEDKAEEEQHKNDYYKNMYSEWVYNG